MKGGAVVCVVCPECGKDVPDPDDLSNFVRFYPGDRGTLECASCGATVTWQMHVRATRTQSLCLANPEGRGGEPR